MTKIVTVDFFRVEMNATAGTLEEAVKRAMDTPLGKERNIEFNTAYVRLERSAVVGDFVEGDMVRIQMDSLPSKGSLDGACSALPLTEREGIAHETAFLYYPAWRILLIQRSKSGVSGASFARYVEQWSAKNEFPVHLEPIPLSTGLDRVARMEVVKKVMVKIASTNRVQNYEAENESVKGVVQVLATSGAPHLYIEMSTGPKHKQVQPINKNGILSIITNLGKTPRDVITVEQIEIHGRTPEGDVDKLRLFDFFMTEKITVQDQERQTTYATRGQAIRTAWDRRAEQLRTMFAPEKTAQGNQ